MQRPFQAVHHFFKLPDSLFGQLLCILLLGIVILQAANFAVVCNVQRLYIRQAEKSRAEHLVTYWFLFNAMTVSQREDAIAHMTDSHRPERLREMVELMPTKPDWPIQQTETNDVQRLRQMVEDGFGSHLDQVTILARRHENGTGIFPVHLAVLETAIELSDGTWLKVTQPFNVDDRYVIWTQRFFVLAEALVMLVLAAIFLSRVTKPMRQLSDAAESFGQHPELSKPLPEKGVKELRDATQSFNRMRERICGNLAERDRMIAAMAHDLRTPLTKLQLRLDRVEPESLRLKLQESAAEVRAIINQGLELAKSLNTEEPLTRLDMRAFLQSVVDDHADVGNKVVMLESKQTETDPIIIEARPLCLKRCLENLISNACAYGGGAGVSLTQENDHVVISIRDKGPGIPEEMLERVFDPYVRLEPSRNRSSGGIGLGLTIARNMALLNNGKIILENIAYGGLLAKIVLPLSSRQNA